MATLLDETQSKRATASPAVAPAPRNDLIPLLTFVASVAVLIWAYWNTLATTATFWDNPKYSFGFLVPAFTLALLWIRREFDSFHLDSIQKVGAGAVACGLLICACMQWIPGLDEMNATLQSFALFIGVQLWVAGGLLMVGLPSPVVNDKSAQLVGLGLLAGGLLMRLVFTYSPRMTPDMYSFVPCLAGLFLLVGGWNTIKWSGAAIAFLFFMFPLPGPLDTGLLQPMQKVATIASTYCLQTLGIATYREGNVIFVGEVQMGVVEACSGLRMLTVFIALAVAITLVTNRPIWERIVIVLSAVPIALAVNIIRITVTGLAHLAFGPAIAEDFHEGMGLMMPVMALGMLYVVFQVLAHLTIQDGPTGPLSIGRESRAAHG